MKLGIAYNIFNGDELLLDSLKRMRKVSDYIVLTYQTISNVGTACDDKLIKNLESLDKDLYDDIVLFTPSLKIKPAKNETNKRNLGVKYAKKNNCTHFMSIDCDEFYDEAQFLEAKKQIEQNGYESTACELVNYFHSSEYQIKGAVQYVPFIYKLRRFRKHVYRRKFPVHVDPTRIMTKRKFFLFERSSICMHHMSYVRKDYQSIKSKLDNSPNKHLYEDVKEDYLQYFNDWNPSQAALNPHQFRRGEWDDHKIKKVSDNIEVSVTYIRI